MTEQEHEAMVQAWLDEAGEGLRRLLKLFETR